MSGGGDTSLSHSERPPVTRTLDDVAHRLRRNKDNGDGCVLLIGAGCSVSAGIPSPSGFVEIIQREYPVAASRAKAKDYPHCMGELSPADRHRLMTRYIDTAKINWAHIAIAQLMAAGIVDRVLTTNFDSLVMRACALFNIFPAVHDMVTLGEYRSSRVRARAVFHLHGQRDGLFQAHVKADVDKLEAKLAPLFQDCANRRTWIVVGYSGANDPVFRQLLRMNDFDHELYWIGYRDTPMPDALAPLMEEGRGGFWIADNWDADTFLYQLADRVGCPPPPFIATPFTHLRETLKGIAAFRLPGQDSDIPVTQEAIKTIDAVIAILERDGDGSSTALSSGSTFVPQSLTAPKLAQTISVVTPLLGVDGESNVSLHSLFLRLPPEDRRTNDFALADAFDLLGLAVQPCDIGTLDEAMAVLLPPEVTGARRVDLIGELLGALEARHAAIGIHNPLFDIDPTALEKLVKAGPGALIAGLVLNDVAVGKVAVIIAAIGAGYVFLSVAYGLGDGLNKTLRTQIPRLLGALAANVEAKISRHSTTDEGTEKGKGTKPRRTE